MSSLTNVDPSASRAGYQNRGGSSSTTPPPTFRGRSASLESRFTPRQDYGSTRPATSRRLSEDTEATMLGVLYDGGKFDHASSVTLQDQFAWHAVDANERTQRIPSTIVPGLLQGISDLSPPSSSIGKGDGGSREVDEDSSASGNALPRYSAAQKGKWKAQKDDDVVHDNHWIGSPGPQIDLDRIDNSVEDWLVHNRPILQDYADRQVSLPLGRRLEVSIDEPPSFILGAIQLLVNRDREGTEHSRRLGPQLIENFVDIDCWAKEYFRSRHGTQRVNDDVSSLLTIVINNFYEGQVQLVDRLVEFALEHMRVSGRSCLGVEDFAFGFDFKMSQDLPFSVETSSRIRKPLPVRNVEVCSAPTPVITSSGRQVKPTERAQAASEQARTNAGRRNKGKNTSQVKDKRSASGSASVARHKKGRAQPSSGPSSPATPLPSPSESHVTATALSKMTSKHTKHRPTRSSNLRLPPILPASPSKSGETHPRSDESSKPNTSASASANTSPPRSEPTVQSSSLKIKIPGLSLPASMVSAANEPGSSLSNALRTTNGHSASSARSGGTRRVPRNRRGHGRQLGNDTLPLETEIPESTSDSTRALQTTHPVAASSAVASSTVNSPVAHRTRVATLRSAVDSTRSSGAASGTGPRDNRGYTSRRTHTGKLVPPLNDPSHPEGKKRKLDDCED